MKRPPRPDARSVDLAGRRAHHPVPGSTLAGILLAGASLLCPPAMADDTQILLRGLQQIQGILEREDRAAERRQQQAEMEKARREAAEARRAQAQAEDQQRAREAERESLTPPAPWAGQLVFHRRQLEREEPAPPAIRVPSTQISVSPDGRHLAYIRNQTELVLRELPSGSERVLRQRPDAATGWWPQFAAGGKTLLLNDFAGEHKELMDLQGARLQTWQGKDIKVWPDGEGRLQVSEAPYTPELACRWVSYHDAATGAQLQRLDLPEGVERCHTRYSSTGRFELLAVDGDMIDYYVDGLHIRRFRADSRRYDNGAPPVYAFVGQLPYAHSVIHGEQEDAGSYQVWDLAQGGLLCELPYSGIGGLVGDDSGLVYLSSPPTLVRLPSCERRPLAPDGLLQIDGDLAFLHRAGEVSVLGTPDLTPTQRFPVRYRDKLGGRAVAIQRVAGQPRVLAVGPWSQAASSQDRAATEFFNLDSGKLMQTLPGGLMHRAPYTSATDSDQGVTQLWRLSLTAETGASGPLLAALQKDKYESSAEHQARVAALNAPLRMNIRIDDYDAEQGHFTGTWRGVPIGIPVPRQQARALDGIDPLVVEGTLGVLDADFLHLRKASVMLPDGSWLALPDKPLPPRQPMQPTAPAPGASIGKAGGASTAASCTGKLGYLAPRLLPYSAPELKTVRDSILGSAVAEQLDAIRSQGGDAVLVRRQAQASEAAARSAAQTADDSDGGQGSIGRADAGRLPLDWRCEGIHGGAVCMYVAYRWEALVMRELADLMERCS